MNECGCPPVVARCAHFAGQVVQLLTDAHAARSCATHPPGEALAGPAAVIGPVPCELLSTCAACGTLLIDPGAGTIKRAWGWPGETAVEAGLDLQIATALFEERCRRLRSWVPA